MPEVVSKKLKLQAECRKLQATPLSCPEFHAKWAKKDVKPR
jgi:hypothetical protein